METIELAQKAAIDSGEIIRHHFTRLVSDQIHTKGASDVVTDVDKLSEQTIIAVLKGALPTAAILSEERDYTPGDSDYTWIVDPLDGTNNYIHKDPWIAVSIALMRDSEIVEGVVYNPLTQQMFAAQKGAGAYADGVTINVSTVADMHNAMLLLERSPRALGTLEEYYKALGTIHQYIKGTRRKGAAALDLCYIACGGYDLFWGVGLKLWDVAAGSLITSEAGGKHTRLSEPGSLEIKEITIAGNADLFDEFALRLYDQGFHI